MVGCFGVPQAAILPLPLGFLQKCSGRESRTWSLNVFGSLANPWRGWSSRWLGVYKYYGAWQQDEEFQDKAIWRRPLFWGRDKRERSLMNLV